MHAAKRGGNRMAGTTRNRELVETYTTRHPIGLHQRQRSQALVRRAQASASHLILLFMPGHVENKLMAEWLAVHGVIGSIPEISHQRRTWSAHRQCDVICMSYSNGCMRSRVQLCVCVCGIAATQTCTRDG